MNSSGKSESPATLYLIPTPLGKTGANTVLPDHVMQVLAETSTFFVENVRSAQRFLDWAGHPEPDYRRELHPLPDPTDRKALNDCLDELTRSGRAGLLSEAGCPAIADPGAELVYLAHRHNIRVEPLSGPSSIFMALMASGLPGQQFAFNGYLPVKDMQRKQAIRSLEGKARRDGQTQLFMEAPHRNRQMMQTLLQTLKPDTRLAVAANLTMPDEHVKTRPAADWQKSKEPVTQVPCIFIIGPPA